MILTMVPEYITVQYGARGSSHGALADEESRDRGWPRTYGRVVSIHT